MGRRPRGGRCAWIPFHFALHRGEVATIGPGGLGSWQSTRLNACLLSRTREMRVQLFYRRFAHASRSKGSRLPAIPEGKRGTGRPGRWQVILLLNADEGAVPWALGPESSPFCAVRSAGGGGAAICAIRDALRSEVLAAPTEG